jgi:hypothetical protein
MGYFLQLIRRYGVGLSVINGSIVAVNFSLRSRNRIAPKGTDTPLRRQVNRKTK